MKIRLALFVATTLWLMPVANAVAATPDVATGGEFTCFLEPSGTVKCVGSNEHGQLGDGTFFQKSVPVPVTGITNAVAISAGEAHACAVLTDGSARCWGDGWAGQLGNGAQAESNLPVMPVGLSGGVTSIAAGRAHTCAAVNGGAQCWGAGGSGQVGDSHYLTSFNPAPRSVTMLWIGTNVTQVAAGDSISCAIHGAGAVRCWGANNYGNLGTSPADIGYETALGAEVVGISGATAISAGRRHACAVVAAALRCWGSSDTGQLGNGGPTPFGQFLMPVGGPVSDVSVSRNNTCAVIAGVARCWGSNANHQLGDGGVTPSSSPVTPAGLDAGVHAIASSLTHTCALAGGSAHCWGARGFGQLGDGTHSQAYSPQLVPSLTDNVSDVETGGTSCAIRIGIVHCWGSGTIGDGVSTSSVLPIAIASLGDSVDDVTVGGSHACAIAGTMASCWGTNSDGAIGDGTIGQRLAPVPVASLGNGVTAIAAGGAHTCAIDAGAAKCWGDDDFGQVGDDTSGSDRLSPVDVSGLGSGVTAITTGSTFSCAVVNGGARCWGDNRYGQLGDGSGGTFSDVPVTPTGLSTGVTGIVAGSSTACALVNGQAHCWGSQFDEPTAVPGAPAPVQIMSYGSEHGCLVASGALSCWGRNDSAVLGNGKPYTNTLTPLTPVAGLSDVTDVAAGWKHTCAISSGALSCWGSNAYRDLGLGEYFTPLPSQVLGLANMQRPVKPISANPPGNPPVGTVGLSRKNALQSLRRKGLRLRVQTDTAVAFKISIQIEGKLYNKLRGAKLVTLASKGATTAAPSFTRTVTLTPSRAFRRTIAKLKSLRLKVRLELIRPGQATVISTRSYTLKS